MKSLLFTLAFLSLLNVPAAAQNGNAHQQGTGSQHPATSQPSPLTSPGGGR